MKTISIILEDDLLEKVEELATRTERTRSWTIRRAVREFLKKEKKENEKIIKTD